MDNQFHVLTNQNNDQDVGQSSAKHCTNPSVNITNYTNQIRTLTYHSQTVLFFGMATDPQRRDDQSNENNEKPRNGEVARFFAVPTCPGCRLCPKTFVVLSIFLALEEFHLFLGNGLL